VSQVTEVATVAAGICRRDTPLTRVARQMAENHLDTVVVVGDDHEPIGIVTEGELFMRGVACGLGAFAPVEAVMSHVAGEAPAEPERST
jgi:signal-transduction protein with cAMP-binding, CBS, and nucleotidyltransferase domain